MVYFIIINSIDWSGIRIWNRLRGILKRIILRLNPNITIINGMVIESSHNIRNHRTGFVRRSTWFEVNFWRLAVTISWWLSCLITMKCVELVHISHKYGWEEVRFMGNVCISLLSNFYTASANMFVENTEICNDWIESCCYIFGRIWIPNG